MNKIIIPQLVHFKRVTVPKYIDANIQKIALKHLGLADMGKLRDRMEGQYYYNKLKIDLVSEFAFESFIGIKRFDWKKREPKSYPRKKYYFENKTLKIITFYGNALPEINATNIENSIFIYVNTDNKVLISGIATTETLKEILVKSNVNQVKITDFEHLATFNTQEELEEKLTS
ncbi:MAG: hypothetical protein JKY08_00575 [Flavobacteriaceae bacterium]|nr:hypothetical protein [Flavobacteriaceae bacterium]